jgi:uncharacterized protein
MKVITFEQGKHILIDWKKGRWSVVEGKRDGLEARVEKDYDRYFYPISRERVTEENSSYPVATIVLHISDYCNLKCKYCAACPKNEDKMSSELGSRLIEVVGNSGYKKINFEFHGGEPLTNLSFIRDFIDNCQEKLSSMRVTYTMQTNGTLLTDSTLDYLQKHNVGIGLSLDGTREVNDANRGEGTFDKIMGSIGRLRQRGISAGIISVVTSQDQFSSIFDLIKEHGIEQLSLNDCLPQGRAKGRPDFDGKYLAESVLKFGDRIMEYNLANKKTVKLRNLAVIASKLIAERQDYMCSRAPCGAGITQLSMKYNGDLFPCHEMLEFDNMRLGNIRDIQDISAALKESPVVDTLKKRRPENIYGCNDCYLDKFCPTGCPSEQLARGDDLFGRPNKCGYYKALIEGMMVRIYSNFDGVKSLM